MARTGNRDPPSRVAGYHCRGQCRRDQRDISGAGHSFGPIAGSIDRPLARHRRCRQAARSRCAAAVALFQILGRADCLDGAGPQGRCGRTDGVKRSPRRGQDEAVALCPRALVCAALRRQGVQRPDLGCACRGPGDRAGTPSTAAGPAARPVCDGDRFCRPSGEAATAQPAGSLRDGAPDHDRFLDAGQKGRRDCRSGFIDLCRPRHRQLSRRLSALYGAGTGRVAGRPGLCLGGTECFSEACAAQPVSRRDGRGHGADRWVSACQCAFCPGDRGAEKPAGQAAGRPAFCLYRSPPRS